MKVEQWILRAMLSSVRCFGPSGWVSAPQSFFIPGARIGLSDGMGVSHNEHEIDCSMKSMGDGGYQAAGLFFHAPLKFSEVMPLGPSGCVNMSARYFTPAPSTLKSAKGLTAYPIIRNGWEATCQHECVDVFRPVWVDECIAQSLHSVDVDSAL